MRPHRRQPTRLPRPWDSPGKNTGVGCHFLLQCVKVKVKLLSRVRLCDSVDCSLPGSSVHGIFRAIGLEWGAIAFSELTSSLLQSQQQVYLNTMILCGQFVYPLSRLSAYSLNWRFIFLFIKLIQAQCLKHSEGHNNGKHHFPCLHPSPHSLLVYGESPYKTISGFVLLVFTPLSHPFK